MRQNQTDHYLPSLHLPPMALQPGELNTEFGEEVNREHGVEDEVEVEVGAAQRALQLHSQNAPIVMG